MTRRAVVIGSSMGGLLSGAALAGSFDEVLLLERGELSDEPLVRAGVPQGAHAHGLLAGGLEAIEALIPGLLDELARSGCPTGDNLSDAAWVFGGRRLARGVSGVRGMCVARPKLENAVRARVLGLPNMRLRTSTRVTGLAGHAERVTGVRVNPEARGHAETVTADLVVDASGRSSKLPEWLGALGVRPPRVDEVTLETRYASRFYPRRPDDLDGAIALLVVSDPELPRGGIALAVDRDRWLVSLYSMGGERPPVDAEGFAAFSRTLASPRLAELLDDRAPLGDAATLRFPSSIRRRYEASSDLPSGLVVCADALCSFNPTFGQGITVAAKQAVVLRELSARRGGAGFERAFLRRAAELVDVAWNASVGRTFLYPGVEGRPNLAMRLANAYLPRVVRRAHADPVVATALLRAMHFLAPPGSLFSPGLLLRVLRPGHAAQDRSAQLWHDERGGRSPDSLREYAPR